MNTFVILLVCTVGLAAAGILDNGRILGRLSLEDTQDGIIGDGLHLTRLTREELLRQKFLLDVLQHVNQPLVNVELLQLANTLITDQTQYIGGIDEEMLHVIELARNQRLLSHREVFTIANEDHLRQMIGLYRLLVRARDWETLQRNICWARTQVNGVLLVNSLLLAIRDRIDTQNLILPGVHEILPELYLDQDILRKVQNIDLNLLVTDTETLRPGLLDMVGLSRRARLLQRNIGGGDTSNIGLLDKTQLWMPWREMRLELALRKGTGEKPLLTVRNENKLVLPVEQSTLGNRGLTLLTEDIGLKSFLHGMILDLCLKEDLLTNKNRLERIGLQDERDALLERQPLGIDLRRSGINLAGNERMLNIGQSRLNIGENAQGIRNIERLDDDKDDILLGRNRILQSNLNNRDGISTTDVNNDRLLVINRRRLQSLENNLNLGRSIGLDNVQERRLNTLNNERIRDDDELLKRERLNRGDILEARQLEDLDDIDKISNQRITNRLNIERELPTIDINDQRLLHVNRRRLQAGLNNIDQERLLDLDNEQKERLLNIGGGGRVLDGRHILRNDDDLLLNENRRTLNLQRNRLNRDDILERQDISGTQRLRGDGLDDITRLNRLNIQQNLPTTDINDERLLRINRRRLQSLDLNIKSDLDLDNERIRFLNVIQGGRVHDGRQIIRDDDTLLGLNRDDINEGRQLGGITNERLLLRNRLNVLGNQRITTQADLPTIDINDERLLRINRRRLQTNQQILQQERGLDLENERERFLNVVGGGRIRGGRRIAQDDGERLSTNERRINLNRDRILLERDIENERLNLGLLLQQQGLNIDLPTTTIDDERLLHVNRRRLQSDLNTRDQLIQRGLNLDDELEAKRTLNTGSRRNSIDLNQRRPIDLNDLEDERLQRLDIDRLQQRRRIDDELKQDSNTWQRRIPRSLDNLDLLQNGGANLQAVTGGEILVHNLRQLLARINLQRLSLGLTDLPDDVVIQRLNNPRLSGATGERLALRLNEMRLDTRRNRLVLEGINKLEQRLNTIIEQQIQGITGLQQIRVRNQIDVDRIIGEVLLGRIEGISLLQILREILLQTEDIHGLQTLTQLGLNLRDPIMLHLLRRIVHIIDLQRQQLGARARGDLLLNGVTINNVLVDKLQTLTDVTDTDLINLLDSRVTLDNQQIQKELVARHQRLNHKEFTINIDVTSDRNQRVVVRTLLGPQIDITQLNEQRQNFLLLDAQTVNLVTGRNNIKRRSRDIIWTARDTTPLTEIYKRVLQTLNGNLDLTTDRVNGLSCRFPHRLLLPIGRVEGLPMQLLVVITPAADATQQQPLLLNKICGMGVGTKILDHLPLDFPLDRQIDNVQDLLTLGNLRLKNVLIHHDDRLNVQLL